MLKPCISPTPPPPPPPQFFFIKKLVLVQQAMKKTMKYAHKTLWCDMRKILYISIGMSQFLLIEKSPQLNKIW